MKKIYCIIFAFFIYIGLLAQEDKLTTLDTHLNLDHYLTYNIDITHLDVSCSGEEEQEIYFKMYSDVDGAQDEYVGEKIKVGGSYSSTYSGPYEKLSLSYDSRTMNDISDSRDLDLEWCGDIYSGTKHFSISNYSCDIPTYHHTLSYPSVNDYFEYSFSVEFPEDSLFKLKSFYSDGAEFIESHGICEDEDFHLAVPSFKLLQGFDIEYKWTRYAGDSIKNWSSTVAIQTINAKVIDYPSNDTVEYQDYHVVLYINDCLPTKYEASCRVRILRRPNADILSEYEYCENPDGINLSLNDTDNCKDCYYNISGPDISIAGDSYDEFLESSVDNKIKHSGYYNIFALNNNKTLDGNQCTVTSSFTVDPSPSLPSAPITQTCWDYSLNTITIDFGTDQDINSLTLTSENPPDATYDEPEMDLPVYTISNMQPADWTITATNINGCSSEIFTGTIKDWAIEHNTFLSKIKPYSTCPNQANNGKILVLDSDGYFTHCLSGDCASHHTGSSMYEDKSAGVHRLNYQKSDNSSCIGFVDVEVTEYPNISEDPVVLKRNPIIGTSTGKLQMEFQHPYDIGEGLYVSLGSLTNPEVEEGTDGLKTVTWSNIEAGTYDLQITSQHPSSTTCELYQEQFVFEEYEPDIHEGFDGCYTGEIIFDVSSDYGAIQYSSDGVNFYSAPVFPTLVPNNQYTFYVKFNDLTPSVIYSKEITYHGVLSLDVPSVQCHDDNLVTVDITGGDPNDPLGYRITVDYPELGEAISPSGSSFQTKKELQDILVYSGSCMLFETHDLSLPEPVSFSVDVNHTGGPCKDVDEFEIIITPTGGAGNFAIDYGKGQSEERYPPDQAITIDGTFTPNEFHFEVSDTNNCIFAQELYLGYKEIITLKKNIVTNIESGYKPCDNNGTITVNGIKTDPEIPDDVDDEDKLKYSIDGVNYQTDNEFQGIGPGEHHVSVKLGDCVKQLETVTFYEDISITNAEGHDINCVHLNNGTVTVEVSGGNGNYTYVIQEVEEYYDDINSNSTTAEFTSVPEGTYEVRVTDGNGCYDTYGEVISISTTSTEITGSFSHIDDSECHDNPLGEIFVYPSGGNPPYEFSADGTNFSVDNPVNGLHAGDYPVYIKDSYGCQRRIGDVNITGPAEQLSTAPPQPTDADDNCETEDWGIIPFQAVFGGGESYTYHVEGFDPQEGNGVFDEVSPGTYDTWVSDEYGCSTEPESVTVGGAHNIVVNDVVQVDASGCYADKNGSITVVVENGQDLSYYLTGTASMHNYTGIFEGLAKGTYNIRIEDDNYGCIVDYPSTITLNGPDEPSVSCTGINPTSPGCYNAPDGRIIFTFPNAQGTLYYSIDDGMTWSNNNEFINLSAGTYFPRVKDNCIDVSLSPVTLTGPQPILTQTSVQDAGCFGGDGRISVIASGGAGHFLYSFDGGSQYNSANTYTGPAGFYDVWVKDDWNCTQYAGQVEIAQPEMLSVTGQKIDVTCHGAEDATVTFSASGGSGFYDYSLNGSFWTDQPKITGIRPGLYTVMVRDQLVHSCTQSGNTLEIIEPDPVDFETEMSHEQCVGWNDGSVTITASGGNGGYEYAVDNTNNYGPDNIINGLAPGVHTVYVRDSKSCSAYKLIEIEAADELVVANTLIDDVSCFGGSNGTLTVFGSGRADNLYTYSIDGANTFSPGNMFANLASADYEVAISDDDMPGCISEIVTVFVPEAEQIVAQAVKTSEISCFDQDNGHIEVAATGGSGSFEYSFENGSDGFNAVPYKNNCTNTTYQVIVRDAADNTCETLAGIISFTRPAALSATINVSDATCPDKANGIIDVNASGGWGQYDYSFDGGASFGANSTYNNLLKDDYYVTIRDRDFPSCIYNHGVVSVDEPDPIEIISIDSRDVSCYGGSDGEITVYTSGDPVNYNFSFDGGNSFQAENIKAGLTAGFYDISVVETVDADCYVTANDIQVDQMPEITVNVTKTDISCYGHADGSIFIQASGGSGYYEYKIREVDDFTVQNMYGGLDKGDYIISVRDANHTNCVYTSDVITILEPDELTFENIAITDVTCFGGSDGSMEVDVSGGSGSYLYSIDGSSFSASNELTSLPGDSYFVYVSDATATYCQAVSDLVDVRQPDELAVSAILQENVHCYGMAEGQITVVPNGGWEPEYSINGGIDYQTGNVFQDLPAGEYTICIREARNNSCFVCNDQTTSLTQPDELTFASIDIKDVTCNGGENGSVTVTASGGHGDYDFSFDNGNTFLPDDFKTNLQAGDYTLYIKDINYPYCISQAEIITVEEPAPLVIQDVDITDVTCFGKDNGQITIIPEGGSGLYEYQFESAGDFLPVDTKSDYAIGTYDLTIRDANDRACLSPSRTETIQQPDPLGFVIVTKTDATCYNTPDGTATVFAEGGSGTYEYSFDGGQNFQVSNINTSMPAGLHEIIIRDVIDAECALSYGTIEILQPQAIEIESIEDIEVSCSGGTNGEITVHTVLDESNYMFSFDGGSSWQISNHITGLTYGEYHIMLKMATNTSCILDYGSHILPQRPQIEASAIDLHNVTCKGGNNGSFTVSTSQANDEYIYSIDGGTNYQDNPVFNDLTAGIYEVLITERNDLNCSFTLSDIEITEPDPISLTTEVTIPGCTGNASAAIEIHASGGSGTYEYSINNGTDYSSINIFSSLSSGAYEVLARDALELNCISSPESVLINDPGTLEVLEPDVRHIACSDGDIGEITVLSQGGIQPEYSIDGGTVFQSGPHFTGLPAGEYSIVIREKNDHTCFAIGPDTEILKLNHLVIDKIIKTDVTCKGMDNGFILAVVYGGSGEYKYSYDGGATFGEGNVADNLAPGDYALVIRDKNSVECSVETSVTITEPETSMSVTAPVEKSEYDGFNVSSCGAEDGWINISSAGGTGEHMYSFAHNNESVEFQASSGFTNLGAGFYEVQVIDEKECVLNIPVILTNKSDLEIEISSVSASVCGEETGSATVSATGGTSPHTFQWSDPMAQQGPIAEHLSSGIYYVSVTDAESCVSVIPVGISDDEGPDLDILNLVPVTCPYSADGAAELDVVAGQEPYDVKWADDILRTGLYADNLSKTRYVVEVTDNAGCKTLVDVNIPGPDNFSVQDMQMTEPSCTGFNDGALSVDIAGGTTGYTFHLTNQQTSFPQVSGESATYLNDVIAGPYQLQVTDINNCVFTHEFEVAEPEPLETEYIHVLNPLCSGATEANVEILAKGGTPSSGAYTYTLDGDEIISATALFENKSNGNYLLEITDGNNCFYSEDVTVEIPDELSIIDINFDEPLCHGELINSIDVSAEGGTSVYNSYTYQLIQGQNVVDEINGPEASFVLQAAGTYTVQVIDDVNCTAEQQIIIHQPDELEIASIHQVNPLCFGLETGSLQVNMTGGTGAYNYIIAGESATVESATGIFTSLHAGTYSVEISDENGCAVEAVREITQPEELDFTGVDATNPSCFEFTNGTVQVVATGGTSQGEYTYEISGNSGLSMQLVDETGFFDNLPADSYSLLVTDDNACVSTEVFELTDPAQLSIENDHIEPPICFDENNASYAIQVTGGTSQTGNYNYILSQQASVIADVDIPDAVFHSLSSGNYHIEVTDDNLCLVSKDIEIIDPDPVELLSYSFDNPVCYGTPGDGLIASATGGTHENGLEFRLYKEGSILDLKKGADVGFENLYAGNYSLIVRDDNRCQVTQDFEITQPEEFLVTNLDTGIPICHGGNEGFITIEAKGGTSASGEYSYDFNNGQSVSSSNSASGMQYPDLTAGLYEIDIIDDNKCLINKKIVIDEPGELMFVRPTAKQPTCRDDVDASIISGARGGTIAAGYTFNLFDNNNNLIGDQITQHAVFDNLPYGDYRLELDDDHACHTEMVFNIENPEKLIFTTVESDDARCYGALNNQIYAEVDGGIPENGEYNFSLLKGNKTVQAFKNSKGDYKTEHAGDYTIKVKDDNGCIIQQDIQITQPPAIRIKVEDIVEPICFGGSDGALEISVRGGTAPNKNYDVNFKSNAINKNVLSVHQAELMDIPAANYNVTAKDEIGCSTSLRVRVNNPEKIKADYVDIIKPACVGTSSGAITILAKGGSSGAGIFTYELFDNNGISKADAGTKGFFTNLPQGDYQVKITDEYKCQRIENVSIADPEPLTIDEFSKTAPLCYGENTGLIEVSPKGGTVLTDEYSYTLKETGDIIASASGISTQFEYIGKGDYLLEITDDKSCLFEYAFDLTEPTELLLKSLDVTEPLCYNDNNGLIKASAKGGKSDGSYLYALKHNNKQKIRSGNPVNFPQIESGFYTMLVSDQNKCLASQSFLVEQPDEMNVISVFQQDPNCFGGHDGVLSMDVTGGTSGSSTYDFTIHYPDRIFRSFHGENLYCDEMEANYYTILAEDDNGCTVREFAQLDSPPELQMADLNIGDVLCAGENSASLNAIATGGTVEEDGYIYKLYRDKLLFRGSNGDTADITDLPSGDYQLDLFDNNGCSVSEYFSISEPKPLLLKYELEIPDCNDEGVPELTAAASGGASSSNEYTYSLFDQSGLYKEITEATAKFSNIPKGEFLLKTTDINSCELTEHISVEYNDNIFVKNLVFEEPDCNGDKSYIYIEAGGGSIESNYNYILKQGDDILKRRNELSTTFENYPAGDYTIEILDDYNCKITQTVSLPENDGISIDDLTTSNPSCGNGATGSVSITASGSRHVRDYEFTLFSDTYGPATYYGTPAKFRYLKSGQYNLSVQNSLKCSNETQFTLDDPVPVSLEVETYPVSCLNSATGSALALPSGGTGPYEYRWYHEGIHIPGETENAYSLAAGDYTVMVRDVYGCPYPDVNSGFAGVEAAFVIDGPESMIMPSFEYKESPKAYGESSGAIKIKATGGWGEFQYSLDNENFYESGLFSNLKGGKYTFYIKDKYECIREFTTELRQPDKLDVGFPKIDHVSCGGFSDGIVFLAGIGGTPPYKYSIDYGETFVDTDNFSGLSAGDYTITISDVYGYTANKPVSISEPDYDLAAQIGDIQKSHCNGEEGYVMLDVSGGTGMYRFNWEHDEQNTGKQAAGLGPGVYPVEISDANGCILKYSVEIESVDGPRVTDYNIFDVTCAGATNGKITFVPKFGAPPYTIEWARPLFSNSTEVGMLKGGTYSVKITDMEECVYEQDFEVYEPDPLDIIFSGTKEPSCFGYADGQVSSIATGGTAPYIYKWSNDLGVTISEQSNAENVSAGAYYLSVVDANECETNKEHIVTQPEELYLNIPEIVYICSGSVAELDAGNPGSEYEWSSEGGLQSFQQKISVDEEGNYYIKVSDMNGCFNERNFEVINATDILDANFLLQDTGYIGDEIIAVDVTYPPPEHIEWTIPAELGSPDNTAGVIELAPSAVGNYTIELSTSLGECTDTYQQLIAIYEAGTEPEKTSYKKGLIDVVVLYPNPNDGNFRLDIDLFEKDDVIIQIFNEIGSRPIYTKQAFGLDKYSIGFTLQNLPPGLYMLKINTSKDYKMLKFTIIK